MTAWWLTYLNYYKSSRPQPEIVLATSDFIILLIILIVPLFNFEYQKLLEPLLCPRPFICFWFGSWWLYIESTYTHIFLTVLLPLRHTFKILLKCVALNWLNQGFKRECRRAERKAKQVPSSLTSLPKKNPLTTSQKTRKSFSLQPHYHMATVITFRSLISLHLHQQFEESCRSFFDFFYLYIWADLSRFCASRTQLCCELWWNDSAITRIITSSLLGPAAEADLCMCSKYLRK